MDIKTKTLVLYGDYHTKKTYYLNDFTLNNEVQLIKCKTNLTKEHKTKENPYTVMIMSDLYILLFNPNKDDLTKGKLYFYKEINSLEAVKSIVLNGDYNTSVHWNNIKLEITFNSRSNFDQFNYILDNNKRLILDNYKSIRHDFNKPASHFYNSDKYLNKENIEHFIELIEVKEKLVLSRFCKDSLKELMILYQRVIEICSAKNDQQVKLYMSRLHDLLKLDSIRDNLTKDCLIPSKNIA